VKFLCDSDGKPKITIISHQRQHDVAENVETVAEVVLTEDADR